MLKRLLTVLVLTLMPLTALADDTPTPAPDSAQPTQSDPNSSATQPQTNTVSPAQSTQPSGVQGSQTSPTAGGSSTDSTALQPSLSSGLGSAITDSSGLVAPASLLQAPNTGTDQLRVMLGSEADGAQHDTATDNSNSNEPLLDTLVIVLFVIAAIGGYALRRRQLQRAKAKYAHVS